MSVFKDQEQSILTISSTQFRLPNYSIALNTRLFYPNYVKIAIYPLYSRLTFASSIFVGLYNCCDCIPLYRIYMLRKNNFHTYRLFEKKKNAQISSLFCNHSKNTLLINTAVYKYDLFSSVLFDYRQSLLRPIYK